MKIKRLLFICLVFLGMIVSGCNYVDNKVNDAKIAYSVEKAFDKMRNLASYSDQEYLVKGYVLDEPTFRNDLGQLSFTLVDDLSNPSKKITVFSANSEKDIHQGDYVEAKSYLRKVNEDNLMLTGKAIKDIGYSECNVTKVNRGRSNLTASTLTDTEVSVLEYATYLKGKKEHYPLSDEFIEKYQQKDGGYIDLAKELGLEVDRQKHSPNQKWHFFESWFNASVESGSILLEDAARTRIYTKLLCPELLLWMYEASDVDPFKIKQAMDIAISAKTNGMHISTMASNMRKCVTWDDIKVALDEKIVASSVTLNKENVDVNVGETVTLTATATPSNTTEIPLWNVVEGEEFISITTSGNELTIKGLQEGLAKVKVTYNTDVFQECVINVIDNTIRIGGLPSSIKLDLDETYLLTPSLNKGESNFVYESKDSNIATIDSKGEVKAISYGTTSITITSSNYSEVYKTITVIINDPSASKVSNYNIVYDLGSRTTAKEIETEDELLNTFVLDNDQTGLIDRVSFKEYIYGGANGGRNETKWYTGDILKFGTTNVNGKLTLKLNNEVNYIKITGYVYATSTKIRVGDASSSDWDETLTQDNKTTLHTCSTMNVVSKEVVEAKQTSTIEIYFDKTSNLTIATTNAKPLFITSIEIGYKSEIE